MAGLVSNSPSFETDFFALNCNFFSEFTYKQLEQVNWFRPDNAPTNPPPDGKARAENKAVNKDEDEAVNEAVNKDDNDDDNDDDDDDNEDSSSNESDKEDSSYDVEENDPLLADLQSAFRSVTFAASPTAEKSTEPSPGTSSAPTPTKKSRSSSGGSRSSSKRAPETSEEAPAKRIRGGGINVTPSTLQKILKYNDMFVTKSPSKLVTKPYIDGFVHSASQHNGLHLILIRLPSGSINCRAFIPDTQDRLEIEMRRSIAFTYDTIYEVLGKFTTNPNYQGTVFATKNDLRGQGAFKTETITFTACHFTVKVKPQFFGPGGIAINPGEMAPLRHTDLSETICFFVQDVNAVVEENNSMSFGQVENSPYYQPQQQQMPQPHPNFNQAQPQFPQFPQFPQPNFHQQPQPNFQQPQPNFQQQPQPNFQQPQPNFQQAQTHPAHNNYWGAPNQQPQPPTNQYAFNNFGQGLGNNGHHQTTNQGYQPNQATGFGYGQPTPTPTHAPASASQPVPPPPPPPRSSGLSSFTNTLSSSNSASTPAPAPTPTGYGFTTPSKPAASVAAPSVASYQTHKTPSTPAPAPAANPGVKFAPAPATFNPGPKPPPPPPPPTPPVGSVRPPPPPPTPATPSVATNGSVSYTPMSISPGSKRPASSNQLESPTKKAKRLHDESVQVILDHGKIYDILIKQFNQYIAEHDKDGAIEKGGEIDDHFTKSLDAAHHLGDQKWIETLTESKKTCMETMYMMIKNI